MHLFLCHGVDETYLRGMEHQTTFTIKQSTIKRSVTIIKPIAYDRRV